jgi:biofilm PGA synthesis N-glycosyltransferase PgaC
VGRPRLFLFPEAEALHCTDPVHEMVPGLDASGPCHSFDKGAAELRHTNNFRHRFNKRVSMTIPQPQHTPLRKDDQSNPHPLSYVLITAARDEATCLEMTITSIISQTSRPLRWVVVSDGSTDGTNELVQKYSALHDWIELVILPARRGRHFAGKAVALNIGYTRVKDLCFDVVGNIDADISFESDFFSFLLAKFKENPRLGVCGTPFREGNRTYDYRFSSVEHVSGACQLFRRQCFEEIGGYFPIKGGGIDVVSVLMARMKGWHSQTFTERFYLHHRKMGTASANSLRVRFKDGQKDYALGAHPLWVAFRAVYQMTKEPFLIGGWLLFLGYFFSMIKRAPRPVSKELIKFRRNDQMRRLKAFIMRLSSGSGSHR